MKYSNIAEEARPIARIVIKFYKKKKLSILAKWPWLDSKYCATFCFMNLDLPLIVETQGRLDYHKSLRGFVQWFFGRRQYGEIFIATSDESSLPAQDLKEMKSDGVGLLLVSETGQVVVHQQGRNPALVVNPDPTLKYGNRKSEIMDAMTKFNEVDRKDGLRDLCEIFESEIHKLLELAIRKGYLIMPLTSLTQKDLNERIDTLSSRNAYQQGRLPLIDSVLHRDLHSFRGARNLIDHPVKNKKEGMRRQRQFADRMISGARLLSDLYHVRMKVK